MSIAKDLRVLLVSNAGIAGPTAPVEEIANMALFLCSPAGRNISGQALSVCGNVEVLQ